MDFLGEQIPDVWEQYGSVRTMVVWDYEVGSYFSAIKTRLDQYRLTHHRAIYSKRDTTYERTDLGMFDEFCVVHALCVENILRGAP